MKTNPPSCAEIVFFAVELAKVAKGGGIWKTDDAEALALTKRELGRDPTPEEVANLIAPGRVNDGKPAANPLAEIAEWLRDLGERLDQRDLLAQEDHDDLQVIFATLLSPPTLVEVAEARALASAGVAREADLQKREGYNPN